MTGMKIAAARTALTAIKIFQRVFIFHRSGVSAGRRKKTVRRLSAESRYGYYAFKKKFRCFSVTGISSLSITCKISSQTLRFSLIA